MSTRMVLRSCLASVLLCCAFSVNAERYTIPLLVPAGATGDPHGVVRILNDAQESATVTIHAIDDAGGRTGPAILTLSALSAVELGASELESGDAAKGLSVGLGRLSSEVRLVIDSDVPIVPSAYVRNADGTLAAMNATVLEAARAGLEAYRYDVPVFHPASNATHPSRLRLINPGESAARVTIAARDDAGAAASGGTVELTLPAGGARTLSADQLEVGDNAVLTGRLGAGVGDWRLSVTSDRPIQAVNVAETPSTGSWSNLSTTAVAGWAPESEAAFEARFLDLTVMFRDGRERTEWRVLAGNRLSTAEMEDGVESVVEAAYRYERIGRDAGRLSFQADGGARCEMRVYFESPTSGWHAFGCVENVDRVEYWTGGTWLALDAGATPLDLGAGPDDRVYTVDTAIETLTLPAASGGEGALTYRLSPQVPGLNFDPQTRRLSGTPIEAGEHLMTYRVRDASGDTDWRYFNIAVEAATGGEGETIHGVGDTLSDLPTGTWAPELSGGGRVLISGGVVTVELDDGSYFDRGGHRYTCQNSGGCVIENRSVTSGTVVRTAAGTAPGGGVSGDHGDERATATEVEARSDTDGALESGDVDYFRIVVDASGTLEVYSSGNTDTYGYLEDAGGEVLRSNDDGGAGTNFRISEDVSAGMYFVRVRGYNNRTTGDYTLHVRFTESDSQPSFAAGSGPGDQSYTVGTAISALTLPEANGGDGTLTYSLTPAVPGLAFNATTRRLTGMPTAAGTYDMTYRVRDTDGDSDSLTFTIMVESAGGSGQGTTYAVGNTLSDLPTGTWSASIRGGGALLISGDGVTVRLNDEAYFEHGGHRYTCQSTGGCVIENRSVTSGTVVQTASGTAPGDSGTGTDSQPSFATGSNPGDQSYNVGTAIDALTLPEASGGEGPLTYSLSPEVPGLIFDATATVRRLSGTPSAAGTYNMTYRARDVDGDTDSLSFTVTVESAEGGGQTTTYRAGETLPDLPAGFWTPDVTSGGVTFSSSGGNMTLRFDDGGYIEEGDYRYTCQNSRRCLVENRRVTSGTVVQTAKGAIPSAAVRHMMATPGAKIVLRSVAALDCAGSVDGYRWEQVTGTAVSMDAGAEAPVIVVPDGVEGPMTFRVHASCSSGPDAVDTVSVQVVPPRVERVLSALVDFQDVDPADRPFSREDLSGLLVGDPDSLANYLAAASRGLVDVRFDVLDWLTVGRSRSAYASGAYDVIGDVIYRLSETADLTGYDKVFPAIFPLEYGEPGCAAYLTPDEYPTAQGTTPLGAAWLSGPDMGCVMKGRHAHEYGHTFGFVHSLTLDCHTETGIPVSTIDPTDRGSCKIINECANEACTELREGDADLIANHDPDMLGGDHPRYYEDYFPMVFQAAWQAHAGWLTDEQVVTTTGSHWITSLESLSPTPKAIRLRLGADHAGGMQEYWLESRLRVPDWNEQRNSPCTAAVRLAWPNGTFDGSQLRGWDYSGHTDTLRFDWKVGATDPRSQSEFRDVRDGQAFWDPYRGVRFELTECVERDFEAALKVDVDRTTLHVDPPVVAVLEDGTATVTVTNRGTSIVNVGEPTIGGRHGTAFSLASDECRGATLGPGQTCRIGVESTAASLSFGFLQVPNDDDLAPELAVSLMVLPAGGAVGSHAAPVLAEHGHEH